jgi:hypothetical protein
VTRAGFQAKRVPRLSVLQVLTIVTVDSRYLRLIHATPVGPCRRKIVLLSLRSVVWLLRAENKTMAGRTTTEEVLAYRACWADEEVEQVRDTLLRLEQRIPSYLLEQRRQQRISYPATVLVAHIRRGRNKTRAIFPAAGRDLSRSGVGLLSPLFFEPVKADGTATLVRAANIFQEGAVLDMGLRKPSGDLLWVFGTVMRVCTVQHDFLEVGIRFNGRHDVALEFDFV